MVPRSANANKNLTKPAYLGLLNDQINGGLMSDAGTQRLIYVYFDFEVITSSTCTSLGITYPDDAIAAGMPWPPSDTIDKENIYARAGELLIDDEGDALIDDDGDGLIDG